LDKKAALSKLFGQKAAFSMLQDKEAAFSTICGQKGCILHAFWTKPNLFGQKECTFFG
jgi:hypothetical protein